MKWWIERGHGFNSYVKNYRRVYWELHHFMGIFHGKNVGYSSRKLDGDHALEKRHRIRSFWAFWLMFEWILSGWWFGTFFIFPYIGNNHPNWLIFFRGVAQPPTSYGDLMMKKNRDFINKDGDIDGSDHPGNSPITLVMIFHVKHQGLIYIHCGGPLVIRWFRKPINYSYISTINHIVKLLINQVSYLSGPHILLKVNMVTGFLVPNGNIKGGKPADVMGHCHHTSDQIGGAWQSSGL